MPVAAGFHFSDFRLQDALIVALLKVSPSFKSEDGDARKSRKTWLEIIGRDGQI